MLTYKIHLLRHGFTQGNLEGRYTGRTDLCLCPQGEQELRALQMRYTYPAAEMAVVSPLQRCIQTADILYPDTYTEQWPEFIECDFGAFEGKTAQELEGDKRFEEWLSGALPAPPDGESARDVTQRAALGLNRLFHRMMEEQLHSVALITHGGVLSTMLYGMGLPKRDLTFCTVGNGRGYTVLMTPQLWMRDKAFEIYGVAPYGLTEAGVRGPLREAAETEETW